MELPEAPLRKLKINYTFEMEVKAIDKYQTWLCLGPVALGFYIPQEDRDHLKIGDRLTLTIDLEPRNANPEGPPIE